MVFVVEYVLPPEKEASATKLPLAYVFPPEKEESAPKLPVAVPPALMETVLPDGVRGPVLQGLAAVHLGAARSQGRGEQGHGQNRSAGHGVLLGGTDRLWTDREGSSARPRAAGAERVHHGSMPRFTASRSV
ncbi:MAG TPA: hypothetical protein VEB43_19495 [Anaeromyxobacter sp.]|nr:hypothetical protein [Anaeromyxobacter sp.]